MTNELTDQIREYVEASARPISLAELAGRRATVAPAGRRMGSRPLVLRRPVMAAAAAVAVVAAGQCGRRHRGHGGWRPSPSGGGPAACPGGASACCAR